MKITKKELKQIIREEAVKFKRKLELEKELASIQIQLDEVKAGGDMNSEKNDGVHAGQKEAKFDTKSNNGGFGALVEEDDVAEDIAENIDENIDENIEEAVDIAEIFAEMEEVNEEVVTEEVIAEEEEEETLEENLEEPIEGSSVAQDADEDKVNDNMEKVKGLNESEEVDASILTEEQVRMQKLAGIKKVL